MPRKIQRKTKAKARNVTQTVIVNVSKRGGGSKAPTQPRPTALQQATQLVQAMRPQQGESLVQAQQAFQRLVEPINARLEALLQRQQLPQPINIAQPAINIAPPNISIPMNLTQRFPDINVPIGQPNINVTVQQSEMINELMRRMDELHARIPPQPRERVLDLPDAQLVQPNAPLVPAGPPRLDDPHEDVPLSELEPQAAALEEEPIAEEKQAAQPASSVEDEDVRFAINYYKEQFPNKASMADLKLREVTEIMDELKIPKGKKNRTISAFKDKILAKLHGQLVE